MTWHSIATELAQHYDFSPNLVIAIARVESAGDAWAIRYEPQYRWLFDAELWAKRLFLSEDTERMQQRTSWGLMQVMGAVAREHGCRARYLSKLCDPHQGLYYGILHLKWLRDGQGFKDDEIISAYNQGRPYRLDDGSFRNQKYVDRVQSEVARLEG